MYSILEFIKSKTSEDMDWDTLVSKQKFEDKKEHGYKSLTETLKLIEKDHILVGKIGTE